MSWESLIQLFAEYSIPLCFFGGLIGGEEIIMTLSFLSAAQNLLPLWQIMIFAPIGVFLSDIIVFSIGRFHLVHNFHKLETFSKVYMKVDKVIQRISKKVFLTLLYTKFMYGARILTLLYLGIRKTNFKKFLISDFLVVAIWIIPITLVGWLGGSGFKLVMTIFKSIQIASITIVLFIIAVFLSRKWMDEILLKLRKRLN